MTALGQESGRVRGEFVRFGDRCMTLGGEVLYAKIFLAGGIAALLSLQRWLAFVYVVTYVANDASIAYAELSSVVPESFP